MLFSGKGKHRRPSKATRVAALAGVTGVAIAAPLMAAGNASAATASEWDAVAQCESGGNWSINTGNGYYGGLQFSASTWAAYGGTQFASTADKASKSQQIQIAEKVLAGQGKGAWPSCGVGLSGAAYNGGGSASTGSSSTGSSSSGSSESTTRSTGEQGASRSAERPAAKTPKTVTTPTGKKVKKGDGEYKVVKGDTLSSIAEAHDVKGGWAKLFELNKDIVQDADLIYPGQQLHLK
ncbi:MULTISPECIES: LysM peptidoglycan-binding domain-containing protein [Streptomyces]|jgi:LysM repeat protein|uniref:LysM peptidoglycan-binding domain-containing protein n=1 Tax=Streptomyces bobili TaxID=67280 RepID=A0ABZ1R1X7_9ACTN|nr:MULTISPECIES: transglycosylase family protein [Streptomyces]MDX3569119.1 transglycosylase family protein [Streptomyces sp. ID05-47C]QEU66401.1 LysM peptidoglycan-binding domain-containing protein [Streptomyces galilaeus]GGW36571.1 transglycosylase [Streptomyces galilaeus]